MSIEDHLTKLTAALEANTASMNKLIEASGGKPAAATKSTTASKSASKGKAAAKAKSDEISIEDVADRVGSYLKTGDKDTRAEHKQHVQRIIDHFGAERFTAIPTEKLEEALEMLSEFEEGRVPENLADGDDGDDGDDDAMV